jgi:hypothetical protein
LYYKTHKKLQPWAGAPSYNMKHEPHSYDYQGADILH